MSSAVVSFAVAGADPVSPGRVVELCDGIPGMWIDLPRRGSFRTTWASPGVIRSSS